MINTRGVTTLLTTVLILFLLAGCGNSTDEEAEATAVPPTTESAVEPTAVPAQSTGWSDNPVRVTNLGGDQAIPRIMPGDNGDFYVAWFSNPPGRENYDVRMQWYDAQGNAQWEENGRILSDNKSNTWISDYVFTKDNDGNLILAFQDMRTGSSNLYAYKFSPDGKPLWGENGLPLTDNEGFVGPYPTTVSTPEHITLIWGQETDDSFKITMQRLTPDGDKLWGDDGLIVPGQETESFMQGAIASGGGDQIILVYGIEKQAGSQIMSIYAQKLDKDGNSVWNGGEPILLHESVPFFIIPEVISDGAGGAYIGWYTTELKGFVQHLDADGKLLMAEGGAPLVTTGTNLQISPRLQFSPEKNEVFAFWLDTDARQNERGLSGQKMSPAGELLWGENGRNYIALSRADLGMITPRLTGDNIIVFYAQGETAEDQIIPGTQLKALLVDENGDTIWSQPAILSSQMSKQSNLEVGVISEQEWVAVWSDEGENGRDILMQNLPLSESTELANPASVFCGKQGGTLELRANDDGGQYGVCVFDDGSECEEWAFYRGECKPGG